MDHDSVQPGPPLLLPVHADEFLPEPGRWSRQLGWRVLLASGGALVALWFWPMAETVRANGLVRPRGENSVVQAFRSGTVAQVLVKSDQRVAAGQVLARLDTAALENDRRQLRAEIGLLDQQLGQAQAERQALLDQLSSQEALQRSQLASTRTALEQSRAALDFEEREHRRYESLAESGAVSRSLVDETDARRRLGLSEWLKARQAISEQEARGVLERARLRQAASQAAAAAREIDRQLAGQRTRLREVERDLGDTLIRSPLAGTVLSTNLRHPRQVIQAGQVLATVAPSGRPLVVKLQVPGRHIARLKPGQPAQVRLAACPVPDHGVLAASVASVSADVVTNGAYEVTLAPASHGLTGPGGRCLLRAGMAAQADVTVRRTQVLPWLISSWRLLG
ncbi:MAG: HlyD family efflux transporter periplasmic adaptor subunit [Cyanobacteriota bacterium]|nr:HlyD family efflux transporter periplasmic adaptor subunit [Cyanobacteriota bacterium]